MASAAYDEKMDIGRVLQNGFAVIARNPVPLLVAGAVFTGLPNFAYQYLLGDAEDMIAAGETATWAALQVGLTFLLFIGGSLLQAAALRVAALDADGRRAGVGDTLQTPLAFLLPLLAVNIVSGLGILFGLMLLIVPGIILYLVWSVSVPALVSERAGVFESLSRSAELTSGSRWRILGLLIIVTILLSVVGGVFGMVALVGAAENPGVLAAATAMAATVTAPVSAVMIASTYLELRNVKEGASTDSLAAIFG